jgi:hypothetical protein
MPLSRRPGSRDLQYSRPWLASTHPRSAVLYVEDPGSAVDGSLVAFMKFTSNLMQPESMSV